MENNVLQQLKENIAKVMIGNERTIELVLTCLVAKGHILLAFQTDFCILQLSSKSYKCTYWCI